MEMIKKYKIWLVITLIAMAVMLFFFIRLGLNDEKAIADFSTAYQNYDTAISNVSTALFVSNQGAASTFDGVENKANEALAELKANASARPLNHDGAPRARAAAHSRVKAKTPTVSTSAPAKNGR